MKNVTNKQTYKKQTNNSQQNKQTDKQTYHVVKLGILFDTSPLAGVFLDMSPHVLGVLNRSIISYIFCEVCRFFSGFVSGLL